ncbi:hypothetical protein C4J98_2618 [Pseudomonas orientalis]|uniref:hypothetical protein n=1 Tax=Pseudomonas orientalis TaxID=76758 RepID=UPI000F6F40EA|nr:hypothetical protein [Pseudomonas orientalis]AZE84031.1 hypothetical protein C4J98_2618 [Pseudomonas orientalis]
MAPPYREGDPGPNPKHQLPPQRLIIPEIQLPFASPPPRSDNEQLRTHALAWAQRYGLIGRRGSTTALLDLGVALCGGAPTHRAEILVCWYLWALTLDDRIDDGPWAENGALERFITSVQALTESDGEPGESSRFEDPSAWLADPQARLTPWFRMQWHRLLAQHPSFDTPSSSV